jgi:ABC-type lipoprotein release transport system permease subunit
MFAPLRQLASRLGAFFRRRELDRDFAEELGSHVTMLTEDNIRRGMTPDQARRAAVIRIGGAASLPHDPTAVVSIVVLLTIVSLAACLVPVRRAIHVDPVSALRAG